MQLNEILAEVKMYIRLLILMLFAPGVLSASMDLTDIWSSFNLLYAKSNSSVKDPLRFAVWENNTRRIAHHNLAADFGLQTYWMGLNKFAFHTPEEFRRLYNCTIGDNFKSGCETISNTTKTSIPTNIDYRTTGIVSHVKYQGTCGSCYVFGAVASLESAWATTKGKLVALSEQNVLDCGYYGCDGGTAQEAYKYIITNNGIDAEDDYKYEMKKLNCRYNKDNSAATMSSCFYVQDSYEDALNLVAEKGPASAYINTSPDSFISYSKGIYKDDICTSKPLTHCVAIVGYGEEKGHDYWILKNSWGADWGEEGFMRLDRGNNMCGIMHTLLVAVV